jgi:hypothetical protein
LAELYELEVNELLGGDPAPNVKQLASRARKILAKKASAEKAPEPSTIVYQVDLTVKALAKSGCSFDLPDGLYVSKCRGGECVEIVGKVKWIVEPPA